MTAPDLRSEGEIQADILVAITAIPGAMFYRQNSGLFFTRNGRPVRAAVPGASDIIGLYHGVPVAMEVKTHIGRQRKEQAAFQRAWERAGGTYMLVRSVDDAITGLGAIP